MKIEYRSFIKDLELEIGKTIKITHQTGNDSSTEIIGRIISIDGQEITIDASKDMQATIKPIRSNAILSIKEI